MENIYTGDSMQTAMQHLEAVGMYAQNIVRAWFTNPNNGWAANSPLTIAKKEVLTLLLIQEKCENL